MSDFGLKFSAKKLFFDRDIVTEAVDRATLTVLRRAGLRTRLVARRSMRRRKKSSSPGQPPSAHNDAKLKTGIYAAMGRDFKSTVIGPVLLNQVDELNGSTRKATIPELLEYGGISGVLEQQYHPGGKWYRVDRRRRQNDNPKRIRRTTYQAFPYMTPALAVVQPSLPDMWKNSVK